MSQEIRKLYVSEGVSVTPPSQLSFAESQTSTGSATLDATNTITGGPFTIASGHTYTMINSAFWTVVESLTVVGTLTITSGTVKVLT